MKIEGEYAFDGPRDGVWKLVRDPDVLAACVLGIQSINKLNDNEFTGEIFLRLGPLNGVFGGRVTVSNEQPPASCTLNVEGTGKLGFLKGSGEVVLTEQADGKTLMKYNGELQIGGKVAGVGQRLFDSVSKGIVKHGLDKLNEILKARSLTVAFEPASQISVVQVGQVEQIERVEPVGQVEQVEPVGQVEQAERVAPIGQVEQVERAEPVGQVEQAEQAERVEPVGQVEQAEQTERVAPIGQVEQVEPVGLVGQGEQSERVAPAGQVEQAEPAGQVEQAEQVGQVEQAEQAGQVEQAEQAGQVEQAERDERERR